MPSPTLIVFPALLALCLLAFNARPAPTHPHGASSRSDGKLAGIQAARGLAALVVVVYHFERLMRPGQYLGGDALGGAFGFGHAGVDFFFVLSGFIMYSVHRRDLGRPGALPDFAWRRASRIYPLYWCVTALVILSTALVVPGWTSRFDPLHVAGSLLLLPQSTEPVLGVGWTLVHEAAFYAVFAVGIASRRAGLLAGAAWLALIAAGLHAAPGNPLVRLLASEFNLLFPMGMVAAHVVHAVGVPRPRLWALLGLCGLLGAGCAENAGAFPPDGLAGRLIYGLAATAIIGGIAAAERAGRLRVRRGAAFLGTISYALYLVHVPVMANAAWLLGKAGVIGHVPVAVLALGAVALSVAAAAVLHLWVERPLLQSAQRVRAAWRARAADGRQLMAAEGRG